MSTVRDFYHLTKPGIVYGNAMHSVAGSLFAWSLVGPNFTALIASLVGTSLVIASACVVNCITDRTLDARMERTRHRPLVTGVISVKHATMFAVVLAVVGLIVLALWTNMWTIGAIALCHVTYTVLYAYAKRRSWLGAAVGTIPGALPITAGYFALDPHATVSVWLLTMVILLWQLPHFYALAIYRKKDYARSQLPIISVVKSAREVLWHIIVTAAAYVLVTAALVRYGEVPKAASTVLFVAAFVWLISIIRVARSDGSTTWAKSVFRSSLFLPIVTVFASIVAVAVA